MLDERKKKGDETCAQLYFFCYYRFDMDKKFVAFPGKLLIVGFGSIGTGVLPLILRHIDIAKDRITVITADARNEHVAKQEGVAFTVEPLLKDNYKKCIDTYLGKGDFLLNLSVDVSSVDVMAYCAEKGILYLDTVIEPWLGGYSDPNLTLSQRSNYAMRESMLELKRKSVGGPTAVVAHGANPGLVSHFVKRALLTIARDTGEKVEAPQTREAWGALAQMLGVKVIHIAEYDSQVTSTPKEIGRFENTWSVDGFYSEGINQPSEMGWGTHEKELPHDGHKHAFGCDAAIYLDRPGAKTVVRTWTPQHGNFLGRAVTHNESISIADYLTVQEGGKAVYRPTVHYAYRPCDAAMLSLEECLGRESRLQESQRVVLDEIVEGMDELGVLLMGHKKGAYWYGSQLTIEEARKLAPYQNATGLQVTAAVLGGMVWAMENPTSGLVEADEIDFERVLEVAEPYLGTMKGEYTDWTPIAAREGSFAEEIDPTDPWQFKNFRFS